ncbi:RNA polymerase sigma-70 factor, ECF subfamily [Paenibacillus sp. UNCCL117]|uniref:RNA polymerase sigma factor n=1 Tax=unclassified Paenibacillus TaxID=185978 RepID=UPI00088F4165|nr:MULTISPECIES: RNA polymerase sigma factor [unclassified Paenibacillus]SDE07638.1 RNA polymerase sigma-70 factor, ECF subfamily [Paenibacillus sp. cl123]SFW59132.1 RNA polymerase sigma-70 factor, ECF subfamily [Paenibacillus sp. UNCCL117]
MAFEYLKSLASGMDKNEILSELMQAYGDDVWNYAYFLTRKATMADDIAQDVFVKVYERMFTFRGEASVRTWLLTITRNTVRDQWRSAWFRRVIPFSAPRHEGAAASAEAQAIEFLEEEAIWTTVLQLPAKLREVLLLHAHHQLSYRDIAGMLGISEGTVKSRLSRARAKVSQQLAAEGREPV